MQMKKFLMALLVLMVLGFTGCFGENDGDVEQKAKVTRGSFVSTYPTMYFRGTSNSWTAQEMKLVADNTWQIVTKFGETATERFKFDVKGDWSVNFGEVNADFTADINGKDIFVKAGITYKITFNDSTKKYSVVSVDKATEIKGTFNYPSVTVSPNEELWINTKTFGKAENESIVVVYTYNGESKEAVMISDGVEGNYYKWHISLGKIALNQEVTYKVCVKDSEGTILLTDDNAGKLYSIKSAYKTGFGKLYFRGTPNEWKTTEMKLVDDNTWKIENVKTGITATERFKFDVKGDWSNNYGDNNSDGIADYFGKDIPLDKDAYYDIIFNESTKKYTVENQYQYGLTYTVAGTNAKIKLVGTEYNGKFKTGSQVEIKLENNQEIEITGYTGTNGSEVLNNKIIINGNKNIIIETKETHIYCFDKTYGAVNNAEGKMIAIDNGYAILGVSDDYRTETPFIYYTDLTGEITSKIVMNELKDDFSRVVEYDKDGYIVEKAIPFGLDKLIRYNQEHTKLWEMEMPTTTGSWSSKKILKTKDNGYFIATQAKYSIAGITNKGYTDMHLIKVDAKGNKVWENLIGTEKWDTPTDVIELRDGSFIISGNEQDSNYYGVVIKVLANGKVEWKKIFGASDNRTVMRSAVESSTGEIIVVGWTISRILGKDGKEHSYLIKLDKNGNKLAENVVGAGEFSNDSNNIKLTQDGNFVFSGNKYIDEIRKNDIYLAKINSNLEIIWERIFGTDGYETGIVEIAKDGGFIISSTKKIGSGIFDDKIWIIKTDSNGIVR